MNEQQIAFERFFEWWAQKNAALIEEQDNHPAFEACAAAAFGAGILYAKEHPNTE